MPTNVARINNAIVSFLYAELKTEAKTKATAACADGKESPDATFPIQVTCVNASKGRGRFIRYFNNSTKAIVTNKDITKMTVVLFLLFLQNMQDNKHKGKANFLSPKIVIGGITISRNGFLITLLKKWKNQTSKSFIIFSDR